MLPAVKHQSGVLFWCCILKLKHTESYWWVVKWLKGRWWSLFCPFSPLMHHLFSPFPSQSHILKAFYQLQSSFFQFGFFQKSNLLTETDLLCKHDSKMPGFKDSWGQIRQYWSDCPKTKTWAAIFWAYRPCQLILKATHWIYLHLNQSFKQVFQYRHIFSFTKASSGV